MKYLLTLLMVFCVSLPGRAQTKSYLVKGRVVADGDFLPLAGASVQLKGSSDGTSTDGDGVFSLNVTGNSATLLVSFIGYQQREVSIRVPSTDLRIVLKENSSLLKEVVVSTGYQSLPQERTTGSFSKVDNELLNRVVATDVFSKLEYAVPGLTVNRSSFGAPTISIRGQSTIMGNSQPLIVVDNFPYDGDLNNINPNDVLSVTVLKDAAAASIWGTRAGNGVIVITTKKGRADELLSIGFTSNLSIGQKPDLGYLPLISSSDFIDFEQHLFNKGYYTSIEQSPSHPALSPSVELMIKQRDGLISGAEANSQFEALKGQKVQDDMNRYFFQNSIKQQYALNLKGGSNSIRYYFSGGYDHNQENETRNNYKRVTLNSSMVFNPLKQLELQADINYNQSNASLNNPGISLMSSSSAYSGKKFYPYALLADGNGNALAIAKSYDVSFVNSAIENGYLDWNYRPLEELQLSNNQSDQYDLRSNAGVKYSFNSNFNAELKYQYERAFTNSTNLQSEGAYYSRDLINQFSEGTGASLVHHIPVGGILDQGSSTLNSQNLRGQLNFLKDWNQQHLLSLIGGVEVKQLDVTARQSRVYGYDSETLQTQQVDYTSAFRVTPSGYYNFIPSMSGQSSKTDRFRSFYANGSYTFKERYTLSASGRIDQSNFFGVSTNQRSVPLWSAGLSWNISKEPFYKPDWLPQLKLRATYGYNGNIDKTVTAYTTARYTYDWLKYMQALEIINPPNPELRWEKIGITNFGLDFETKNRVLYGSIEYYLKQGKDLIGNMNPDPTSGVMNYRGNLASMRGSGVDLNLNSRIMDKAFTWNAALLFSYVTDKITHYTKEDLAYNYTALSTGIAIFPMQGRPVYSVYSYRFAGLDTQSGDPMGYVNGEKSTDYASILNTKPEELIYNGPARPTYQGALRNTFGYKQFQLSFNIGYKLGYFFRRNSISYSQLAATWSGHSDYALRWQQAGDEQRTSVPSVSGVLNASRDDFYLKSEALVENGSHIRLQDINLSYTLDRKRVPGLPFQQLQLYVYMNNVGILWRANDQGIDPDAVPNGGALYLPQARSVAFGVKVGF
ncbi:SusC/RagA family TonB-linked outer membrane protein [Solitalea longa]|uniref:SusC/RagA family TonB-linked outer membrane protein n=1 Tax=Solitalea longa TaxID=2079460 RepID=A0A2S5A2E3_9SPHI|nr:SusC/RagA family TonB-linked outer membrane protein [Solitalea longa]POY36273.1 SusC/RagA family TonB-linked outer membrane protein [Solitalea longa]